MKSERVKLDDKITVIARFQNVPVVVFARVESTARDALIMARGEFRFTGAYGSSSVTAYGYDAEEGLVWLPGWSDENKAILNAVDALRDPELTT